MNHVYYFYAVTTGDSSRWEDINNFIMSLEVDHQSMQLHCIHDHACAKKIMVIPYCTDPSDDLGHNKTDLIVGITVPIVGFLILIVAIAVASTTAYYKCKGSRNVVSNGTREICNHANYLVGLLIYPLKFLLHSRIMTKPST